MADAYSVFIFMEMGIDKEVAEKLAKIRTEWQKPDNGRYNEHR